MSGKFITDLALNNLKRNRRAYLPYALSCIGTVMMCFILYTLAHTNTFKGAYGGRSIQRTLQMGVWVMLLFAVIFVFYTHSFLVKRRKQEFGVFNMLGLEKRHIGRVLLVETFLMGVTTTAVGIGLGALLSKLMYLLILRVLEVKQIAPLAIPRNAFVLCTVVFLGIHALTWLNTLRVVHVARPVQLLRGSQMGERQPKARFWLVLLGLLCLGYGYYVSLSVREPLKAIPDFLKAVLAVIVGTYLLFTTGTISMLSLMQRNKRFYYHPRHFSVIGGMRHRMKRNAVGLASICILSTMVLVMGAATANLFMAREDMLKQRFYRQMLVSAWPLEDKDEAAYTQMLTDSAQELGITLTDRVHWRSLNLTVAVDADRSTLNEAQESFTWSQDKFPSGLFLVPLADYRAKFGDSLQLAKGEMAYYSMYGEPLADNITLCGHPLKTVKQLGMHEVFDTMPQLAFSNYTLVMHEEDIATIGNSLQHVRPGLSGNRNFGYTFHYGYNIGSLGVEKGEKLVVQWREQSQDFFKSRNDGGYSLSIQNEEVDRADFNALYGGLLFVAVFLGSVFIMAMVLIIYYKQVSEGYEDQGRYLIMQQVGMSQQEVKQSITSQVLMVFFLPLLMAGIHLLAAFNILWQVMKVMSMSNLTLFVWVCVGTYAAFALFYLLVYLKTAGSYYRIVRAQGMRRDVL